MKIFLIAASLMVSTLVQANPLAKFLKTNEASAFVGEGTWRMADGSTDKWTGNMTIESLPSVAEKQVVQLTWDLQIYNQDAVTPMTATSQFVFVDNSQFFAVFNADGSAQTGRGYCEEQVCHFQMKNPEDGTEKEETWQIIDNEHDSLSYINIIGSHSFASQNTDLVYTGKYNKSEK